MATVDPTPPTTATDTWAREGLMGVTGTQPGDDALITRLRRIEGQVRGIARMVDQDAYCIDVLTQVSAATRALQSVGLLLLDEHLRHCLADAARSGDAVHERKVQEVSQAIGRLVRS
ncbi:MAG: metal-sensitive transcriptional regulator [Actinobacteria bacterium]|jgi:DNA-binding FrmR family transcriptional regulator|nr:metal-sensitive transcriptional regulator [Actinomycetota bacterium]